MASLHVYLGYRDAGAAIGWLERAFGFEVTMRHADGDGGVAHAELRLGEAALVVFSDRDGYSRPPRRGDTAGQGVYLVVSSAAEVEGVFARAVAEGAVPVWEPAESQWGNHRFRVLDPEGFEWTFGTHRPGLPAAW